MGKPGKRRNKKQQPFSRSQGEDTVHFHYGEYISPRAMGRSGPSRFLRCETGLCKPCTCSPLILSQKPRLTRTPMDFGEVARRQTRLKPASSRSAATTEHN